MDRISIEQRSKNMAAVKSRGNKSTELKLVALFRKNKITGWRRHYKRLKGTPDFAFPKHKLAVFIDGCFWHGCKQSKLPTSNRSFWKKKITSNKERDRRVNKNIRAKGWKVVRIWEHEIKEPSRLLCVCASLLPD